MSKKILETVREASISIACCLDEPSDVSKRFRTYTRPDN